MSDDLIMIACMVGLPTIAVNPLPLNEQWQTNVLIKLKSFFTQSAAHRTP